MVIHLMRKQARIFREHFSFNPLTSFTPPPPLLFPIPPQTENFRIRPPKSPFISQDFVNISRPNHPHLNTPLFLCSPFPPFPNTHPSAVFERRTLQQHKWCLSPAVVHSLAVRDQFPIDGRQDNPIFASPFPPAPTATPTARQEVVRTHQSIQPRLSAACLD